MLRAVRKPLAPVVIVAIIASLLAGLSFASASHTSRALASAATGTGGEFVATQGRVLDTRPSPNTVGPYSTAMTANAWRSVQVTGVDPADVPADASAVQVTVAALSPASVGAASVSADLATPKAQLVVNYGYETGSDSNTSVVPLGSSGKIKVLTTTAINVLIDVQGYYTGGDTTAAGGYVTTNPTRIVNTSNGTGLPKAQIASGATVTITVAGLGGVPAGASAVFLNIAAQNASGSYGFLTPYAADASRPSVSLNYPNNASTSFGTTVALSADGKIKIFVSHGPIDLYVDVFGYFDGSVSTGAFTPAIATVAKNLALSSGTVKSVQVTGTAGVPLVGSGIAAVAYSLTATNSGSEGGYIRVWSTDATQPDVGVLNFPHVASTVTNFVTTAVGHDGKINMTTSSTSITATLTVLGWYSKSGGPISSGQTQTQKSVALQADANAGTGSYVTYQYRLGTTGSFTNVPTVDVAGSVTWPDQLSGSGSSAAFPSRTWNIAQTLGNLPGNGGVAPDSLVQVQACYGSSSTDTNLACGLPADVDFSQDSSEASAEVGPGSVSELTGDFSLSETDADAATSLGDLSAGRTLDTLHPAGATTGADGVFGPGWTADLSGPDSGSADLTPVDHSSQGYILLTDTDGDETTYAQDPNNAQRYVGEGDDADDTSIVTRPSASTIILTDADSTVTTWTKSGSTWQVASVNEPGSNATTTYSYNGSGLVSRILSPVSAGVKDVNGNDGCNALPDSTAGCRSLLLNYSPVSVEGTSVTRLTGINLSLPQSTTSQPNSNDMHAVAAYDYDASGRLAHAWDPRISPALKTAYTYDSSNRLATLSPPGLATWSFTFDTHNRLITASRPDPSGQTATTTVVYDISNATSGNNPGPVDLSASNTAHWGETDDLPVTGTAIFDPDRNPAGTTVGSVTSSDWPYASIDYLDVDGRTVNSAAYGAGDWQVDTTQYDPSTGNEMWSLTAGNWAQALNPTADTDPYVHSLSTASTIDSVDAAALLRSETVYDPLTGNVTDTYGPTHPVTLASGTVIDARTHVATSYDEGAPTTTVDPITGNPVNPASMQPYGLSTTVTTTAYNVQAKTDTVWPDIQVTRTGYDPVVSGDTSGWKLGMATSSIVQMGVTSSSANDLVTYTRYDANGRTVESRLPGDAGNGSGSGSGPRSTDTSYYAVTGSGPCVSRTSAGLVCSTAPAGQPSSGNPLPVVTYTYNQFGDPTAKTETYGTGSGQVIRTSSTGYDAAERPTSSSITVSPSSAGGTAVPAIAYGYDSMTGLPNTTSTGTGPGIVSLSTGYNNIGEETSYTDATGNVSHAGYDLDGHATSRNDGKGATGYTYDGSGSGEHRGVATGEDIGVLGSPSAFSATYDAAGDLSAETYPNGLVASRHYDNAGDLTSLVYAKSGSTWMSFIQNTNALGQIANQTSPQSSQTFTYDPADRLATVADTYSGSCSTRVYAFDTDSNRTSLKSYPGTGAGGATCSNSTSPTTTSYSYDAADRLTSDTAGSYTYDSLGRSTLIPANDANGIGAHAGVTGAATISYDANDMVATEQQGSTTDTFTLDPDQNRVNTQIEGSTTTTNHYIDDGDSPAWTASGGATWKRNVTALDGNLAAVVDQLNAVTLEFVNPQGDVVANGADSPAASAVSSYSESNEYGIPRSSSGAYTTYGWLGGDERSSDDLAGLVTMGVRLYSSAVGRFESTDPVYEGNASAYIYPDDPVNNNDLSGKCIEDLCIGETLVIVALIGGGTATAVAAGNGDLDRFAHSLNDFFGRGVAFWKKWLVHFAHKKKAPRVQVNRKGHRGGNNSEKHDRGDRHGGGRRIPINPNTRPNDPGRVNRGD